MTRLADEAALERAFGNLIRNAIQYGGGTGEIAVRVHEDGAVSVRDEGIGIAPDRSSLIFEPFYRVNPQGSGAGLGLAMVRQIVESHSGRIAQAPNGDRGSIFTVTWLQLPEAAPATARDPTRQPSTAGVTLRTTT